MKNCFVIWRRELSAMFLSHVAYLTLVFFLAAAGGSFLFSVFQNVGSSTPPQVFLFDSLILWLSILISAVTMRLFAEERKSGTLETLMTAPVTDAEVVIGKYAGALSFVLLAAAPVIACLFFLDYMSPGIDKIDIGSVKAGSLFVFLFCSLCVAAGEWISLHAANQIIAAIGTFCAVWLIILGGWILQALPFGISRIGEVISVSSHLMNFERGIIDTRPVVFFVSTAAFFIFACVRTLELRRGN